MAKKVEMETVSFIGAGQRLGLTVAEVRELVSKKRLKEISRGRVSLDAVYKISDLKVEGSQTKKVAVKKIKSARAGPVPEATKIEEVKEVEPEEAEPKPEPPFDMQTIVVIAQQSLERECEETLYSQEEMEDALATAYMRGKLSVYEEMSEFKMKVSA